MDWFDLGEVIKDPYVDIRGTPTNDSELWLSLLLAAKKADLELFYRLCYLRGTGCQLVKNDKIGYKIMPLIGHDAWMSQEQYDKEKQCLVPYKALLIKLLKELKE